MERLEIKRIKGNSYYYYSMWGKVDGKCRRLWQRYLGTPEAILEAVKKQKTPQEPLYAEVFQYGLPVVLWKECQRWQIVDKVNQVCKKREQGLSIGEYISIAAINRAISAVSKSGIWEWFSQTSLLRQFPGINADVLSSQQFWNHMEKISVDDCKRIWEELINDLMPKENIDLSSVSYDGTNFYTYIDTFNARCSLAKRGKNKQGRNKLRQINYALFCTADGHLPLLYDVYEGNCNDVTHFPIALERFQKMLSQNVQSRGLQDKMTIVFDKGNNAKVNFDLIDFHNFFYVTSVKSDEQGKLGLVSNDDPRFEPCVDANLEGTKSFRIKSHVFGKERTVIVTYSNNLYHRQWLTLQADITKALSELSLIQQNLEDRRNGIIKLGVKPTLASVKKRCQEALARQHLKEIIVVTVTRASKKPPRLKFEINQQKLQEITDVHLGKNIILTNRDEWNDCQVITAYRGQYIIEDVFKEVKDRDHGSWWPQYHWTDSKIHVHGLYCTIALLLRGLIWRRTQQADIKISMDRILTELNNIREVVNIYQGKGKNNHAQTILTKRSEIQERLMDVLGIPKTSQSTS